MNKLAPVSVGSAIRNGICKRCPRCGEGPLFYAYLKPVSVCAVCGEDFSQIRADDGPAWLTILLVGHVIGPIAYFAERHEAWPLWAVMSGVIALAIAMVLMVLPHAKGAFIGAIWALKATGVDVKTAGHPAA